MISLLAAVAWSSLSTLKPGECLPRGNQRVCVTQAGRLEIFIDAPIYWTPSISVHPDPMYPGLQLWDRWYTACLGDKDTRECPRGKKVKP